MKKWHALCQLDLLVFNTVYNDGLLDERLLCFEKQAKIEIENVEVLHSVEAHTTTTIG